MPAPGAPDGVFFSSLRDTQIVAEDGTIVFEAEIDGVDVDDSSDTGVWVRHRTEPLELLARRGAQVPGPSEGIRFVSILESLVNASGEVALRAHLDGPGLPESGSGAILLPNRDGHYNRIAYVGGSAPGTGPGTTFIGLGNSFWFNDAGEVAFGTFLDDPAASAHSFSAWVGDADGNLRMVARTGDTAPGLPEAITLSNFERYIGSNNAGDVAFSGSFQAPLRLWNAIWAPDSNGVLKPRVTDGTEVPGVDRPSNFLAFNKYVLINEARQVVFWQTSIATATAPRTTPGSG